MSLLKNIYYYVKNLPKICHLISFSRSWNKFFKIIMVTIVSKCFWVFSIHYIDFKIQDMYIDILKIKLYKKYIFNFFKKLVVRKNNGY